MATRQYTAEQIDNRRRRDREYKTTWRKSHAEQNRAQVAAWKRLHPEETKAAMKKWASENRAYLREYNRNWAAENREALRASKRAYWLSRKEEAAELDRHRRSRPSARMRKLVTCAKSRAKVYGMDFEESLRQQLSDNPPTNCVCCGVGFDYSMGRRKPSNLSPSLDRRDNSKGYTVENTRVICNRCNRLKGDATIDDLERILAYARG